MSTCSHCFNPNLISICSPLFATKLFHEFDHLFARDIIILSASSLHKLVTEVTLCFLDPPPLQTLHSQSHRMPSSVHNWSQTHSVHLLLLCNILPLNSPKMEDLLTLSECQEVITNSSNGLPSSVISYEIRPVGDQVMGFLGEYFRLTVQVEQNVSGNSIWVKVKPQLNQLINF